MSKDDTKKVRGDVLHSWMKFIKKRWGQDGVDEMLSGTGIKDDIKEGTYYPQERYEKLLAWVRETHGEKYLVEGGRSMLDNFGLLAYIVRFAGIKMVAKRVPNQISEFFSFGKVEAKVIDDKNLRLRVYDITTTEDVCQAVLGSYSGVIAITKTKGTPIKTKCVHKGDKYCEYQTE